MRGLEAFAGAFLTTGAAAVSAIAEREEGVRKIKKGRVVRWVGSLLLDGRLLCKTPALGLLI